MSCVTSAITASGIRDFEEAQLAQAGMLPRIIPQIKGFRIAGYWRPAGAFSGDGYDVWRTSEHGVGLCVADVCGKGLPAALLMSAVQAAVRTIAVQGASPAVACEQLNRVMCHSILPGRFVSLFYALVRSRERRLIYTNAGHPPPILLRQESGSIERLEMGGPLLGLFENASYDEGDVELRPGDRLLIYTDGASELTNPDDEEFGDQGLIEVVRLTASLTVDHMQTRIIRALSEFSGGSFHDDVTLLALAADEAANSPDVMR